ncbi:MAG: hypothetical protein KDD42_02965 [Bdellovibrionales bacterium]|nr:hypothetical protein [Bdellovibrionales bacterium]
MENKRKKQVADPVKRKPIVDQKATLLSGESGTEQAVSQEEFWREEIDSLQSQSFATLDHAIESLVQRVIKRLSPNSSDGDQMRQFLVDLIETDEGLKAELQELLVIESA